MSLLGDLVGGLTGSGGQAGDALGGLAQLLGGGGQNSAIVNAAISLLQNHAGGASGFLQSLQERGLGEQVQSWIGTGDNMPIQNEHIEQAVGTDTLQALAEQAGLPQNDLVSGLASVLPQVINGLSPSGEMPQNDLVQQGLGLLASKFFG